MKEISKLYSEMHIRGLLPSNWTGHVKQADPVNKQNVDICCVKTYGQC